jgi:hypothetical protein
MRADRFCVSMIPVLPARVIITVSLLVVTLGIPLCAAEKLPAHPKLAYRQIGAGYTLALEAARKDKTFVLCLPDKTSCISATAVGWRKPFIISRTGGVAPGVDVFDTSSKKYVHAVNQEALPSYLKNIPLYPAAGAWQKLNPTRALW